MITEIAVMGMLSVGILACSDDPGTAPGGGSSPEGTVVTEDFEGYADGERLEGSGAGDFTWLGGPYTEVSSDIGHSGSNSLKFSYGPTEPNGASHWWSEQNFDLGQNVTEAWLEFHIYFPDGTEGVGSARYEHTNIDGSSSNNKFLSLWADSYQSEPLAIWQLWKHGETTNSNINVGRTAGNQDGDRDLIRYPGENHVVLEGDSDRGQWIQFRFHVKVADMGRENGEFRMWKDGVLLEELTGQPFYDEAGDHNYIRRGYLLGYDNGRFAEDTWLYIDDFKVYDSDPGW